MLGESIWQSNWIVQQASKVLRSMEYMASISVRTRLSASSKDWPVNEIIDRSTVRGVFSLKYIYLCTALDTVSFLSIFPVKVNW